MQNLTAAFLDFSSKEKKVHSMKRSNILRIVIMAFVIVLALAGTAVACNSKSHDTQQSAGGSSDIAAPSQEPADPVPTASRQSKLADAAAQNPDTVAWLYLPGTEVDDPVVQAADNDYYLQRSFEGEYSVWGCYFADYLNTLGSRDTLDANTIIYGHAYKTEDPNERKFTQLFHYCDLDFVRDNPYIYLSLDGEDLIFEVCAVFFTDIDFDYINPTPPDSFYSTVAAKNEYIFDGLTLAPGDKVLTLSACSHRYDTENTRNQRLVVMAKLLPEGATVQEVTVTPNPSPERP